MGRSVPAKVEVRRHDWSAFGAPPGSGEIVADIFLRLLEAQEPSEAVGFHLEGKVEVQAMVFEIALPAVGVILAALTDDDLPRWLQADLLDCLHTIVTGEPHRTEIEAGRGDIVEKCVARARDGIWVLYGLLARWNAEFVLDILEFVENDMERLLAFRLQWNS